MEPLQFDKITTDRVSSSLLDEKKITMDVLRLDKIHPVITGNKWFKLKNYIAEALAQKKKTIVTFGGAYSNHIIATAAACKLHGLKSIGIIRGEEPAILSPTLQYAKSDGMQLEFVDRTTYATAKQAMHQPDDENYYINEGGYGVAGAAGAATIADYADLSGITHICCAVGTGTMLAGLMNALPHQYFTGISVMKNNREMEDAVRSLLLKRERPFQLIHDYHFGGYAKHNPVLIDFMNGFYQQTGIPSDFVYTGKLFFAITDLIRKDYFPEESGLLLVHSGGLQGNLSLPKEKLYY